MGIATRYPTGLFTANRQYTDGSDNNFVTRTGLVHRDAVFKINFADGTTTVTTGITLPVGAVVLYPFVNVRTAETTGTTKTIEVGITGTAGGFITGLSVATAGLIKPTQSVAAAVTLGSLLLAEVLAGVATTPAVPAAYAFEPYIVTTAVAVTWTPASTNFASLDADVILPLLIPADLTQMPVNITIPGLDTGN